MNKKLTRIIAFLLAILLIGTSQSVSTLASEYDYSKDTEVQVVTLRTSCKNPVYYSGSDDDLVTYSEPEYSESTSYESYASYETEYADVVAKLRADMVKRGNSQVTYRTTSSYIGELSRQIFNSALEETDKANEGDYLGFQWGGYDCDISYTIQSPYYYVTFTYNIDYYTTAAQEQALDTRLAQVLKGFNFNTSTTRYQKIKTIYDYICNTVTYDNATLNDDSYDLKYTAYAALMNRTAVCQGYAVLYYRMLREAGINARVVAGGNHAWNIVQMNQYYYFADSTWDVNYLGNYRYFLKGSSAFTDHTLESRFTNSQFKAKYPIPSSNYDPGKVPTIALKSVSLDKSSYIYNGTAVKPALTVIDTYGEKLLEGTEYTVSYYNNNKIGTGTLVVKGLGNFTGSITKTFNITTASTVLKSISNTASGVTVNWYQVPGAENYRVYRKTSSTSWDQIATVNGGSTVTYTDTTASAGTTYYYTIRAYAAGSLGGYDSNGLVMMRLVQPKLTGATNAYNGVNITWTKVAYAAGYNIYRKNNGTWTKIATVSNGNTLTYTDTQPASGYTYQYTVSAYYGKYTGPYNGNGVSAVRLTQPEFNSISNQASGVYVNWNKVNGAQGYIIYRKVPGGGWSEIYDIKNGNTTSFTDTKASSGASYTYTIRAYYGNILSSYNSTGKSIKRLAQPEIASVYNSYSGVNLRWNQIPGASGYYVYRSTATTGWIRIATINSGSTLTCVDTTASSGTNYLYTVRAISGSDISSYNNSGRPDLTRLSQPNISSISNSASGIYLKWSQTSGAEGYYVYRKLPGSNWVRIGELAGGNTLTFTDTTATSGTSYIYTVKAYKGSIYSSYDPNGKSVRRVAQPEISSLSNTVNGVGVKWNHIGGSDGYYVYRSTPTTGWVRIAAIYNANTLTYTDTTASTGTNYIYTVRAISGSYLSSYNNSGRPSIVRMAQPNISSISNAAKGVYLKWNQISGAEGYYLYRKLPGSNWVRIGEIAGGSNVTFTDTNAPSGTTYIYTVKAYNGNVYSSYNPYGITIKRLAQPEISSLYNSRTGVNITWNHINGASEYYVYRSTATTGWIRLTVISNANTLTYTDTTASSGTEYIYTVRAVSGSYISSYNNSGRPNIVRLAQPDISVISNYDNGVKAKWNQITGAKGYYVYRKVVGGGWTYIGAVASGSEVTYLDKTASDGVTYIYTVKAYNGNVNSSYNPNGATIKRLAQPSVSTSNVSGGINVNWSRITGADGYNVYRKTGNSGWTQIAVVRSINTLSYVDRTASSGTTYTYTVRAYSGNYMGDYYTGSTIKKN